MTNFEEQAMRSTPIDALIGGLIDALTDALTDALSLARTAAFAVAAAVLPLGVSANELALTPAPTHAASHASEVGHATRAWLELQRSNAVGSPLPTLGEEAGWAYKRYLDSFKTKIPASFGSTFEGSGNGVGTMRGDYPNAGGGASPAGAAAY
jgi:Protein of unknown function (DUF3613)